MKEDIVSYGDYDTDSDSENENDYNSNDLQPADAALKIITTQSPVRGQYDSGNF